jgi:hypothetical protein
MPRPRKLRAVGKPEPRRFHLSGRIYGGVDRYEDVMVTPLEGDLVRVSQHKEPRYAKEYGPVMTRRALEHFEYDTAGRLKPLPPATHADIAAVQRGDAELLGKGDDGLVFRVGKRVVKVSTTVPFQPFNPGHRTPEKAARMLRRQAKLGTALSRSGVPHLQESEYVWLGDKGFQIKDYVEIPDRLTAEHIAAARKAIDALHERGYTLNDDVQIGLDDRGRVVLYDIGKVERAPKGPRGKDRRDDDLRRLDWLARQHGVFTPKRRSDAEYHWEAKLSEARELVAQGDKGAAYDLLKATDRRIRRGLSTTAEDLVMLEEALFEAERELGLNLIT